MSSVDKLSNNWPELQAALPVVPARQPAVDDVFGVPDGGEVGQAVDPVTVSIAGPGHHQ